MKPFYIMEKVPPYVDKKIPENKCGFFFNGYFLQVNPKIYPKDKKEFNVLYEAMFMFTSFLNSNQVFFPEGRLLRITGYTDIRNFEISVVADMYTLEGKRGAIYKLKDNLPSMGLIKK